MDTHRILTVLRGAKLSEIEIYEFGWQFRLSNGSTVTTSSFWRVLTCDGIAVSSEDHRQRFGLPEPIDAGKTAKVALSTTITKAEIAPITGDLRLSFSGGAVLELLNTSSGYEGWHVVTHEGEVIALGGGELALLPSTGRTSQSE